MFLPHMLGLVDVVVELLVVLGLERNGVVRDVERDNAEEEYPHVLGIVVVVVELLVVLECGEARFGRWCGIGVELEGEKGERGDCCCWWCIGTRSRKFCVL